MWEIFCCLLMLNNWASRSDMQEEEDAGFAGGMVQALNLILLTSSQLQVGGGAGWRAALPVLLGVPVPQPP